MKLFLYRLLTVGVMVFANFRHKIALSIGMELRKDRDEQNLMPQMWFSKGNGIMLECCDCGLSHRLFESERGSHAWPERPRGYDYRWRPERELEGRRQHYEQ